MKGKWADGIQPRNFAWVIKDQLAASERPGGYGAHHRRVRRQEEIIWIRQQQFDIVISLIPSPHNLHNYEELGLPYLHRPWPNHDQLPQFLTMVQAEIADALAAGRKVLLHKEEVGDRVCGLTAVHLVVSGLVPSGPQATAVVERIFQRRLGPVGRELVELALRQRDAENAR
ncbi:MAG: hypothetical protein P8N02_10260 [Actinomycetota bacterium]|jgi:hypothetical protein|nr:hypothetical protein [Actinomycetota bacterium]